MEGGALFKVWSEAKERVLVAFAAIDICKNEDGGYACNDANMLIIEIERPWQNNCSKIPRTE